jgi:hypothetical protein
LEKGETFKNEQSVVEVQTRKKYRNEHSGEQIVTAILP